MRTKFSIKYLTDEGGSAGFYSLEESETIGFKEFSSKTKANYAYKTQKKLAKLGLAPKVYGKIRRFQIKGQHHNGLLWTDYTGWGFITQKVKITKKLSRKKIQDLVNKIYKKTKLKFWDCHEYNIGIVNKKYVCIDTGKESFDSLSDAWGMGTPGPFCNECNKYNCLCEDYYAIY